MFQYLSRFMNAPAEKSEIYVPTYTEQVANCLTHGIWIFPAMVASYLMYKNSVSFFHETVTLVYGSALILLFLVSTMYHVLSLHRESCCSLRHAFHKGDRIIIYLFIAASYMPWLLLQDNGGFGDELAGVLCVFALTGIVYSYFFQDTYKHVDTLSYLAIGILPSLPLIYLSEKALTEVAIGGVIYVAGVAFFKSDGKIPFAHAIWHTFVAMGALIHFYAIWKHLYSSPIQNLRK